MNEILKFSAVFLSLYVCVCVHVCVCVCVCQREREREREHKQMHTYACMYTTTRMHAQLMNSVWAVN